MWHFNCETRGGAGVSRSARSAWVRPTHWAWPRPLTPLTGDVGSPGCAARFYPGTESLSRDLVYPLQRV